jgi:hypothetical protein
MHEVNSWVAHDLNQLQIGQGGEEGRGPYKRNHILILRKSSINISLCMWNHKGDFVFVCQKSNPISRENTKPGVTVILVGE